MEALQFSKGGQGRARERTFMLLSTNSFETAGAPLPQIKLLP